LTSFLFRLRQKVASRSRSSTQTSKISRNLARTLPGFCLTSGYWRRWGIRITSAQPTSHHRIYIFEDKRNYQKLTGRPHSWSWIGGNCWSTNVCPHFC
jgi:hypothetical protein